MAVTKKLAFGVWMANSDSFSSFFHIQNQQGGHTIPDFSAADWPRSRLEFCFKLCRSLAFCRSAFSQAASQLACALGMSSLEWRKLMLFVKGTHQKLGNKTDVHHKCVLYTGH